MKEELESVEKLFKIIGHRTDSIKSICIQYELIIEGCVKPKIHIEFK